MKQCPYCAEQIQDEAVKCRHCGEWLAPRPDDPPASDPGLESEVRACLAHEGKIQAIKRLREGTGLGLADAKNAVERMQAGETLDQAVAAVRTAPPRQGVGCALAVALAVLAPLMAALYR